MLLERLRESFSRHAALPAVEGRDSLYTYRQLDRRSAALARAMADLGVRAGDIVPLVMRRSPRLIVAQVAVLRLGAAYAPIDLMSPVARQQSMLKTINPSVALTDGPATVAEHLDLALLNVNDAAQVRSRRGPDPWCADEAEALAYVMFTSGTAGVPKGVMIPRRGIARLVCDTDFAEFRVGARWGWISSPAFDASTLEVWAPLLNGGCCVVQEREAPSLDDLATFLLDNRITDTWLTSALFSALVEDRPDAFMELRQLLVGGERVSSRHARSVMTALPQLRLINGYGPTENTTFTLCRTVTIADTEGADGIPIGEPIRGTVVRIGMDADQDEGELLAGGDGVGLGYLGDEPLTESKFIRIAGQRWYRTGDVVRRRMDGVFEFRGRSDRQVKLQGHRIELDGIERVLSACPGVGQGAVLTRGESAESGHLVACYSGSGGPPPAPDAVADFLRKHLAPSGVPRVLCPVASVPRTDTGKTDYGAVLRLVGEAIASPTRDDGRWRSDAESVLASIWQECFPSKRIHRDTNFVALGGTSLLALQVSARVRRRIGRDLTPIDVLRSPVLADQARLIEDAPPFDNGAMDSAAVDKQLRLTRTQRAILASAQLDQSGCAYLVHVALQVTGAVDREALRRAFVALAGRHPALRLTIRAGADPPHGTVCERLATGWWREHGELVDAPNSLSWPDAVMRVINRPMDLSRDGVMRLDYWPVAGDSSLIVWTVHHVSIDETTIDRCLVELDHLLAHSKLQQVYGSPLGFATFEKALTDHDAAHQWADAFIDAFAGQPPPPFRAPGPGREIELVLPAELARRLQRCCADWGTTPFATLLVGYGLALQDVFGRACRFVSTPFSRRVEPELIEPAGCLLDLCFVEAGSRSGERDADVLARVGGDVLKLQRTGFIPHQAVVEAITLRNPAVIEHVNAFGFTWRLDPARTVPLGSLRARLLRVPQHGARFGVTLHAWLQGGELRCSIEGVDAAFANGSVDALAGAFVHRLQILCNIASIPDAPLPPDAELARGDHAVDPVLASQLRASWSQWAGTPTADVVESSDFLRCGGNSLSVMRMTAQLRRDHGLSIEGGAFLARPTFRNLCALAGAPVRRLPGCCVAIGRIDAPRVAILIPGYDGDALGLYTLAEELHRQVGVDHTVIIADLETMLLNAPQQQRVAFLCDRMEQLIREIGPTRISGLVGHSMGGVFGLILAQRFPAGKSPPVWLLDTYAPRLMIPSFRRRVARRLVRTVLRSRRAEVAMGIGHPKVTKHAERDPGRMSRLWQAVRDELATASISTPNVDVHLVQALRTVHGSGLLWRRSSNGFNAHQFARWSLHQLDASHVELTRHAVLPTAALLSSGLEPPAVDRSE